MQSTLDQLVAMSLRLGAPENDYVILGEGNTSARVDNETFLVKASGHSLPSIGASGFVRVRFDKALALLENEGDHAETGVKDGLMAATVDNDAGLRPSVETTFHALCLTMGGANFVGHTHPSIVNAVLCSQSAEKAFARPLFPDQIVVCGPAPAFVPYVDPGAPLALAIGDAISRYSDEYGMPPKVILLQNHGMIALGKSAQEVESITNMFAKTARTLLGTFAAGGPQYMTPENVERIFTRPDEHYRQKVLGLK
ncbi:MAG: class II aldolase [Caldilineaceae bacterium]|nr:class II aldolase [Caldilineaceae bacterium]MCB9136789.1 class II aldolase [Caldilineaceae bacterium]